MLISRVNDWFMVKVIDDDGWWRANDLSLSGSPPLIVCLQKVIVWGGTRGHPTYIDTHVLCMFWMKRSMGYRAWWTSLCPYWAVLNEGMQKAVPLSSRLRLEIRVLDRHRRSLGNHCLLLAVRILARSCINDCTININQHKPLKTYQVIIHVPYKTISKWMYYILININQY